MLAVNQVDNLLELVQLHGRIGEGCRYEQHVGPSMLKDGYPRFAGEVVVPVEARGRS